MATATAIAKAAAKEATANFSNRSAPNYVDPNLVHTAFTHDGECTIQNTETGEHRSFKFETVKHGKLAGKRIVSLLTGPDQWQAFGFVGKQFVALWKKFRNADRGAYRHFAIMLHVAHTFHHGTRAPGRENEFAPNEFPYRGGKYSLRKGGRCRICGRTLTHPESIDTGIGPICAAKVGL